MTIEFVGSLPTLVATNGGNVTLTFTNFRDPNNLGATNTAMQEGDLVVVVAAHSHPTTGQTIGTSSSGWTKQVEDEQLGGTARARAAVFTKFMTSTIDTTFVATGGGGNAATACAAGAINIRGVDSSIFDVSVVIAKGTGSQKPNPGQVTPLSSGAYIIVAGVGVIGTGGLFTVPSDLASTTNKFRSANAADTVDCAVGIGVKEDWTSGAFDPVTWSSSATDVADSAWIAFTIVLKPKVGADTRWRGVSGVHKTQYFTNSVDGMTVTMNNSPGGPSGVRATNGKSDARRFEITYTASSATNTNGSGQIGIIDGSTVLGPTGSDSPGSATTVGASWRWSLGSLGGVQNRNGASPGVTFSTAVAVGDRFAVEYDPAGPTATLFHCPVSTGVWYEVNSNTLTSQTISGDWYAFVAGYYTGHSVTGHFTSASQDGTPSGGFIAYDATAGTVHDAAATLSNTTTASFDATIEESPILASAALDGTATLSGSITNICIASVALSSGVNALSNSRMLGAVTGTLGSGGALPTGWTFEDNGFLGLEVVGTGTAADGSNYIRLRVAGTNPSGTSSSCYLFMDSVPYAPTSTSGDVWTGQAIFNTVSGDSATGFTTIQRGIGNIELNSSDVVVGASNIFDVPSTNPLVISRTASNVNTVAQTLRMQFAIAGSGTVDWTFDLYGVQLEPGSAATAWTPSPRFYANATIEAPGVSTYNVSATLDGTATLAGTIEHTALVTSGLTTDATLTADITNLIPVAVTLDASGTLAANATIVSPSSSDNLQPDSVLSSADISVTLSDLTARDTNWAVATANTSDSTLRVSFPTVDGDLTGLQTFTIQVRKNGGTGTPSVTSTLYINGVAQTPTRNDNVTNTTSEDIVFTWNATTEGITDPTNIELNLATTASGGGPSVRASVDYGYIEWEVQYVPASTGTTHSASATLDGSATLSGDISNLVAITASLDSTATLAADITTYIPVSSSLTSDATLSGTIGTLLPVSSSLDTTGTLVANADNLVPVSASLTGSGTTSLDATVVVILTASSALDGSAALSGAITNTVVVSSTIQSTSTTGGDLVALIPLTSVMTGSASIVANVENIIPVSANWFPQAALQSNADKLIPVSAALSGSGVLTANADAVTIISADATLVSSATLAANADKLIPVAAALDTSATLAANIDKLVPISASLLSDGTLAANATIEAGSVTHSASSALTADATLTGNIYTIVSLESGLNGAATIAGTIVNVALATSGLTSDATLAGTITNRIPVGAALTGSGTINANATIVGATSSANLQPDAILSSAAITATLTDLTTRDSTWALATATNANSALRVSFPTVNGTLTGVQTFTIQVKKRGGSGTPSVTSTLYINGVAQTPTRNDNVTDTTSQDITFTWNATTEGITDPNDIELDLITTAAAGGGSVRATVDYGYIEWAVLYLPPSATTYEVTAALDSSTSIAADARIYIPVSSALTSTATTSATIINLIPMTSSLTGTGTLAVDATKFTPLSASLIGTATLGATIVAITEASSAMTADATLSSTVTNLIPVSTTLTTDATLTSNADKLVPVSCALTSSGTFTSAATVVVILTGSASLTASATLTSDATKFTSVSSALTANATLSGTIVNQVVISAALTGDASTTFNADKLIPVASALSATATMSAAGNILTQAYNVSASLVAAGTLSGTIENIIPVTTSLAGSGTLNAATLSTMVIQASLSGSGTLAAEADVSGLVTVSASLQGSASLSGSITTVAPIQAAMVSSGTVASNARNIVALGAVLSASGTLSGDGRALVPLTSSMASSASLEAPTEFLHGVTASLLGTASQNTNGFLIIQSSSIIPCVAVIGAPAILNTARRPIRNIFWT